ncbi:hypothetical protein M0657_000756 [Pyricularia oryzae]|uniref:Uncharacterized protein n=1 Tax=Pyricularia oryzae TaxID=318829 RepID=A0A4P7N910_PYROR|nr:hypothetical protein M9X92_000827 [Pyricularia oryzae]KAI7932031.1 hypothetical protein M0657_000756 [Pyricularia oryzae]QBZ59217.1 hypothetical protein PoMZ_04178 [Pyricularia oryzae]
MFLCIAAARLPPTGGDIFHPLGKAGAALAYPEVSILLDQEAKGCVRVHPSSSFSAQNGGATEAQRGSPKRCQAVCEGRTHFNTCGSRLAAGVDHKVSRLRCVGKGAWKEEAENKSKKVGEQWQGLLIL